MTLASAKKHVRSEINHLAGPMMPRHCPDRAHAAAADINVQNATAPALTGCDEMKGIQQRVDVVYDCKHFSGVGPLLGEKKQGLVCWVSLGLRDFEWDGMRGLPQVAILYGGLGRLSLKRPRHARQLYIFEFIDCFCIPICREFLGKGDKNRIPMEIKRQPW